jgi:hypothetical protein
MPYIGRPLNAGNLAVQSGTGDGSDTTPIATLDYSVGSSNSIGVYLDGVRQLAGTDFTASGTVLTFTTAPANGVGVDVYFLGLELSIPTPADGTVATAKIADDAVTLAKMAPGTDGNIISYDASGNPVAIATGNDGQVLTSAGAGAPPAFETAAAPASGMWKFLSTQTASGSSTIDFFGLDTTTYKKFEIHFHRVFNQSNAIPVMRLREAGGPAVITATSYYGASFGMKHNSSANTVVSLAWGATYAYLMPEATIANASIPFAGSVTVHDMGKTSARCGFSSLLYASDASGYHGAWVSGGAETGADAQGYDGIQLLMSTGNFTSGFFSLYGLLEA